MQKPIIQICSPDCCDNKPLYNIEVGNKLHDFCCEKGFNKSLEDFSRYATTESRDVIDKKKLFKHFDLDVSLKLSDKKTVERTKWYIDAYYTEQSVPDQSSQIKLLQEQIRKQEEEMYSSRDGGWISVDDAPPTGTEVLGFHPSWIDEDYNPEGTCVCFLSDEGYWTIAKWCGTCDEWHTAYSENWTAHQTGEGHKLKKPKKGQGIKESDMSTRIMVAPTHWQPKPPKKP